MNITNHEKQITNNMKAKYYLYTSTILLLASCHTYQEKYRRERSRYIALDSSYDFRYGYQSNQRDTFGRRWYFYTDSSFRYHADSGLHARSGWLRLYENGHSGMDKLNFVEQTMASRSTREQIRTKAHETQLNIRPLMWGLAAVLLIILLVRR